MLQIRVYIYSSNSILKIDDLILDHTQIIS